jgi:hypothetical protein
LGDSGSRNVPLAGRPRWKLELRYENRYWLTGNPKYALRANPITMPAIEPRMSAFASFLNWTGLRILAANDLSAPGIRVFRSGWFTLRMIQMAMRRMQTAYPKSPSISPKKIGKTRPKIRLGSTSWESGVA